MAHRRTRRDFLVTSAAAGSLVFVSPEELFGTKSGTVFVRMNVKNLGPNHPDIVAYKAGITAMKALPSTDPLNWNRFANIHGSPSGTGPLWNTCQHGHWWFLPWHRMYLLFFERIIRKLANAPNFSLPYWDYTAGTAPPLPAGFQYPAGAIPTIFRNPKTNNPLFDPNRNGGPNAGINAGAQIAPSSLSNTAAFARTNFTSATGTSLNFGSQMVPSPNHGAQPHGLLEQRPHDAVHGAIGGDMGSFGTAARDPIFWLHHANIDRLWNLWLTQGGGRTDPVTSGTWCRQTFTFFNENRQQVSMRVADVLRAQAQLNYRYEGEPAQVPQTCSNLETPDRVPSHPIAQRTVIQHAQTITLGAGPTRVSLPTGAQTESVRDIATDQRRNLVMRLEGVKIDRHPGVIYEVYVGLPATQPANPSSPHFVGTLSTFGLEHAGAEGGIIAFPIDRAAAAAINANTNNVPITFVPRGLIANGRELPVQLQGRVTFSRVRVIEE